MNGITIFNPEHDLALANGSKHFIAPTNIREMARDLSPLLDVIDGEQLLVWGWDGTVKEQLRRMGIAEEQLPTDFALAALRACSERQAAHHLLRVFRTSHPNGPYTGESIIVKHLDNIVSYVNQHGHIILKDPLSSSGKGLRHVNINEDENLSLPLSRRGRTERIPLLSSSLKKVENWINALITRHGYLTAEPYYDKAQDFAMEFCIREGQCRFIGYSFFNTNHHGRYESNLLLEDEKIESLLTQYVPRTALYEVRDWFIGHSHHIIPQEWDTTKHPLYFGIDMMIAKTAGYSATQNHKSEFTLHPCIEINLRLNMGIIAHEVRRKLLAPSTEGIFHVIAFPSEEAAQQFLRKHTEQRTATYHEGKIVAGYHALTPILPHTRYHAYIMCK